MANIGAEVGRLEIATRFPHLVDAFFGVFEVVGFG
jgi:hypothetical protein